MALGTDRSARRQNRHSGDVIAVAAGIAVVALGMVAVGSDGRLSGVEKTVFRAVNDLPGWLEPVAWPFQQLGALFVGPLVAVVAVALHRYRLAIAALVVTAAKLLAERGVKAMVSRQRPGTSIGADIEVRGDVHLTGESFVSGHAVLVAGLAWVVTPYLHGRWKVLPWLLVGAVMVGRVYVGAHNPLDVVCGAALGIALGGAVNLVVGRPAARRSGAYPPEPSATAGGGDRPLGVLRTRSAIALAVVVCGLAGCGDERETAAPSVTLADETITVGSFDFAESVAVAEVYSQGLEAAGYQVERAYALGPREFVGPAMSRGLVELVPEYAGTALLFHSLGRASASSDPDETHARLVDALSGAPVEVLRGAPAQDANAFVVTAATAERFGLEQVSDLAAAAPELVFGGPPECPTRRLCLDGLDDVYGARFREFVALDAGGPLTHQALAGGGVDVALLFTTDPAIEALGLVELADDRRLQPAENITPILRAELVRRHGQQLVDVIDAISAELTTARVRDLNADVAAGDVPAAVADWWAMVQS
jgi:osmoprotectant transport system substrate-binding protein